MIIHWELAAVSWYSPLRCACLFACKGEGERQRQMWHHLNVVSWRSLKWFSPKLQKRLRSAGGQINLIIRAFCMLWIFFSEICLLGRLRMEMKTFECRDTKDLLCRLFHAILFYRQKKERGRDREEDSLGRVKKLGLMVVPVFFSILPLRKQDCCCGLFSFKPTKAPDKQFDWPPATLTFRILVMWQKRNTADVTERENMAKSDSGIFKYPNHQNYCAAVSALNRVLMHNFPMQIVREIFWFNDAQSEMYDGWRAQLLILVTSLLNPLGSNYFREEQKPGARQQLPAWQLYKQ